jgi:hypothetical protein
VEADAVGRGELCVLGLTGLDELPHPATEMAVAAATTRNV